MHYLKCNTCGHLNEVNSEFLIFCTKCNKKLESNFRDWNKRNPDKNLSDFKSLVCITEDEVNAAATTKKQKPKGTKYWIGLTIAIIISTLVGKVFSDELIEFIKFGNVPKSILEQEWKENTYGKDGLVVETPFSLTSQELPLPDNILPLIDYYVSYISNSQKGLMIMVNCFKYKPEVGLLNLQGAANGSISEMKMQEGVKDFDYTEEYVYLDELPGFIQNGTYIMDKIKFAFTNAGYGKQLVLYQVTVAHKENDEVAQEVAERVIKSIKIEEIKNEL